MRLAVLALLAALGFAGAAVAQPRADEAYAALWDDINANVFLGHPELTVVWGWGDGSQLTPTVDIEDLKCEGGRKTAVCRFILTREPHPKATDAEDLAQPRVLRCEAQLKRYRRDGWQVVRHLPRPEGGHTRSTLTCRKSLDPPTE